jgi:quinol monooxygenase YgiN
MLNTDFVVVTILKIVPMDGKREVLLEILHSIENALRGRAACVDCRVFEQPVGERAVLYFDQWLSIEDLTQHIQSELFLRMLVAMELAVLRPEINFHEIIATRDLSWVKALRAVNGEGLTQRRKAKGY